MTVKTFPLLSALPADLNGLTQKEAALLQKQFGQNTLYSRPQRKFYHILLEMMKEPMFILLLIACTFYFVLGRFEEGFMMGIAILIVSGISVFEEARSTRALEALQKFTQIKTKVKRDDALVEIASEEIVPGDIIMIEEGNPVPADPVVMHANDLMVDESIITGESFPVPRDVNEGSNRLFQGSTVTSGTCYARVTSTGLHTRLGMLGKEIESLKTERTPLQMQTDSFVRKMATLSFIALICVLILNYIETKDWVASMLFGLTLAMSVIPEEIPVAFSSFMALGAFRMAKEGIITKQPQTVESLGSASVICLDKTGTITENKMTVAAIYNFANNLITERSEFSDHKDYRVIEYAMWSSETEPFDPMEKAIHEAYTSTASADRRRLFRMVHEYKLSGIPPMMTHIFYDGTQHVIAAKGAPERIMKICKLSSGMQQQMQAIISGFARKGYRVLGVASALFKGDLFPEDQDDFNWQFEGLIALYDPPKKNIREVFRKFYQAGIDVKMLTGDYAETAITIANESGIRNYNNSALKGDEVMNMTMEELKQAVNTTSIFARMHPEAKLKVVSALKENGEVVAMTGDGVNDGPALKAAHIGIAMGRKGTEIARRASSLILTDDNLEKMVEAIALGRKIYSNLKKAIRYIIAIHIPIILTVVVPLFIGWKYLNIFTPIHIIFLELIMGPTCSIFFENEPIEEDVMKSKPRRNYHSLFSLRELSISILQGLSIAGGVLFIYYSSIENGADEKMTRSLVFSTIIFCNLFLTFVNRSYSEPIFKTIFYRNKLLPLVVLASIAFILIILFVPPVTDIFRLTSVDAQQFFCCAFIALLSVMWLEVYKTFNFLILKKSI